MKARSFLYASAAILALALAHHAGAKSATAQGTAPEVAILTGTVRDGETIPLPHYLDGSEALESDCHWIASIHTASAGAPNFGGVWCYTTGRVVSVGAAGNCCSSGVADYMIVAIRANAPTSTKAATWGEVKSHYRPGAAATPQDK